MEAHPVILKFVWTALELIKDVIVAQTTQIKI